MVVNIFTRSATVEEHLCSFMVRAKHSGGNLHERMLEGTKQCIPSTVSTTETLA